MASGAGPRLWHLSSPRDFGARAARGRPSGAARNRGNGVVEPVESRIARHCLGDCDTRKICCAQRMRVPIGGVQAGGVQVAEVPAGKASVGDVPVQEKCERDSRDVAAKRGKAGGFQSHAEGPCRWNRHGLPCSRAMRRDSASLLCSVWRDPLRRASWQANSTLATCASGTHYD